MQSKGFLQEQSSAQLPQTPPAIHTVPEAPFHCSAFPKNHLMSTPRTPQPQICSTPPPLEPPDPPKVRIKRRRPVLLAEDIPQPENNSREEKDELADQNGFLTPSLYSAPSASSRPRTPLTRLQTSLHTFQGSLKTPEPWSAQSALSKGESITRPSSTWSEISDSSASSISSFATFATHGESCTSPESEVASDPFVSPASKSGLMPSAIPRGAHALRKRAKKPSQAQWSPEMDDHLWLTYMTYLSDPMVTPFKTLPGIAPPLGVCHRVSRHAKKQWKGPRPLLGSVSEHETSFASLDDMLMHRQSLLAPNGPSAIIRPSAMPRSSSAGARWNPSRWPHSGSATRKRLRELCKRKPTLSPHYQRLMHTRSPSPFESSSSQDQSLSSPRAPASQSSFSTKDMNMTLSTSTASTMQPGNTLSQFASSSPKTPQRASLHVKSRSLQSTFGVANEQQHQQGLESLRRLASPFQEQPRQGTMPSSSGQMTLQPPQLPVAQQRRLGSPLEIQHPKPMSASMKRRAQYQLGEELLADDPELRQSFLEDIFRDPAVASGKRRVRSRGFSLGMVRHVTHASKQPSTQLAELFTPPMTEERQIAPVSGQADITQPGSNVASGLHRASHSQLAQAPNLAERAARRLGSPFVPTGGVAQSNTFPRSLFPQGLDSLSNLESQRHQQGSAKPDVEMEDPFVESASGTIRRLDQA